MQDFQKIIDAPQSDRKNLFSNTAIKIGTTIENIEKDFWVCFVLKLLFEERRPKDPRLLFKGGTSLSKAYGLISRFSEDIDITVFREDIGENIQIEKLNMLSKKQRQRHIQQIHNACQSYIQTSLYNRLHIQISKIFKKYNIDIANPVVLDPDDPDKQTLLIYYPSVVEHANYIKPYIKIEAGAKSALEPHQLVNISPYIANDINTMQLQVNNIVTINAERTFWDKIIILHGLRAWFDNRNELRHQGNRISRHYYDVFKLINSQVGQKAMANHPLANECTQHAQIFFHRTPLNLEQAIPGSFKLTPTKEMLNLLTRDYKAMSTMIFGDVPSFEDIIESVITLENNLNFKDP